jgi:hypothetical protein
LAPKGINFAKSYEVEKQNPRIIDTANNMTANEVMAAESSSDCDDLVPITGTEVEEKLR